MASDTGLDILVEQAAETLRGKGEKVTFHNVKNLVRHRTEDVLRAYQRYTRRQRAKREAELSNALSLGIAAEVIKDRETYTEDKTKLIKEEAEQLQADCEVLNDEILGLREELAEVKEVSKEEKEVLTKEIDEIQVLNTELNGQINSQDGEIKVLKEDRDTARNERSDYKDKYNGIKRTLHSKSNDERKERTRADNLQTDLKNAEKENQLLQETNNELRKDLKASQDQVELEKNARKEAEGRIIKLNAEIKKLQKTKTSTGNQQS